MTGSNNLTVGKDLHNTCASQKKAFRPFILGVRETTHVLTFKQEADFGNFKSNKFVTISWDIWKKESGCAQIQVFYKLSHFLVTIMELPSEHSGKLVPHTLMFFHVSVQNTYSHGSLIQLLSVRFYLYWWKAKKKDNSVNA